MWLEFRSEMAWWDLYIICLVVAADTRKRKDLFEDCSVTEAKPQENSYLYEDLGQGAYGYSH